ncbi:MAG: P-loop NTPase [Thermoproteota archaeon]
MKATAICAVKGGVGKTLLSLNIAYKLKEAGKKVALIDADIDNSNFCSFTNAPSEMIVKHDRFVPYDWHGIQVFSMSLIAGREKGISQSADRYERIIDDVVENTEWDAEYFVLDLPAGSGNVFRAVLEIFAEAMIGNVIVSQPGTIDATKRVLNLHKYFEIPVLGVVENMSYFRCSHGEVYKLFGESDIEDVCKKFGVPFVGRIPLSADIAKSIREGNPIIKGEGEEVIDALSQTIISAQPVKTGFLDRLKQMVDLSSVKLFTEKLLAQVLLSIKKEFSLRDIRVKTGFTEKRPFLLVITDASGTKEITRVVLRVEEDGIKVIKNPKTVDFEIHSDIKTLARLIMGKKKVDGNLVDVDPEDFWLAGDIRVYGRGFATRAISVIREVFKNPELMAEVRSKYGKILEGWL